MVRQVTQVPEEQAQGLTVRAETSAEAVEVVDSVLRLPVPAVTFQRDRAPAALAVPVPETPEDTLGKFRKQQERNPVK